MPSPTKEAVLVDDDGTFYMIAAQPRRIERKRIARLTDLTSSCLQRPHRPCKHCKLAAPIPSDEEAEKQSEADPIESEPLIQRHLNSCHAATQSHIFANTL